MISAIAGIVGFLTNFLPGALQGVLGFFQDRRDKAHELEMLRARAQIEADMKIRLGDQKLAGIETTTSAKSLLGQIRASADERKALLGHDAKLSDSMARMIEAGSQYAHKPVVSAVFALFALVESVRASVRPVVTYGIVGLYVAMKYGQVAAVRVAQHLTAAQAVRVTWTPDDYAVLMLCLGFWFGGRVKKYIQERPR